VPVVEAQLLSAPVLTSSAGSLAEIAGEGALFADALDAASIARGICCFCPEACYANIGKAYATFV